MLSYEGQVGGYCLCHASKLVWRKKHQHDGLGHVLFGVNLHGYIGCMIIYKITSNTTQ